MQDKPDPPPAPAVPPDAPEPAGQPEGHDEVEASKAPLLDHLIELRTRLIHALIGVGAGFLLCFYFATGIYNLLVWPYQVARHGQRVDMIFTAPHEFLFTKLKLALFGAVFLAFPLIAYEVYKFVAPGLYKNERQAFRPYLFATFLLFILGAAVVYFVVMPLAMTFFLSMEQTGGDVQIQLQAKVSEYLSLIMTLILGFGIMFQLPVVLALLARAGIIGAAQLRQFRRYAIVAITGAAAVLSPPDPFSMIAMALPTILLYEAAILVVDRVEKGRLAREAEAQAEASAS
jgi:sec-independent protein translocase protein TatC